MFNPSCFRAFLGGCLFLAVSSAALGQFVSVCREVSEAIDHPAEYAVQKLQKCTQNIWDLVTPHCCLPGWEGDPVCYIEQQILQKDAWTEFQKVVRCDTESVQTAANSFAQWFLDPKMVALQPFKPLFDIFEAVQAVLAGTQAKPLPADVRAALTDMVGRKGVPFTESDIDHVRWVSHNNATARVYSPQAWNFPHDSITYGRIIVAGPQLEAASGCSRIARWAHEVTHSHQYAAKGYDKFLVDYIEESTVRRVDYDNLAAEVEAKSVESLALTMCSGQNIVEVVETLYFVLANGGAGKISRYGSVWNEYHDNALFTTFVETGRDASFIYLYDANRQMEFAAPMVNGLSYFRVGQGAWTGHVNMERQLHSNWFQ